MYMPNTYPTLAYPRQTIFIALGMQELTLHWACVNFFRVRYPARTRFWWNMGFTISTPVYYSNPLSRADHYPNPNPNLWPHVLFSLTHSGGDPSPSCESFTYNDPSIESFSPEPQGTPPQVSLFDPRLDQYRRTSN